MAHFLQQLPADVWLHVFRCLPAADKLNVRVCSKYFNQLVSHPSLWKDHTARFFFKRGRYNRLFWTSLARRRIHSAVVQGGTTEKHWTQLALTLPDLDTLIVVNGIGECCRHLNKFPNLRRLALRGNTICEVIDGLTVADPRRITFISLCDVDFHSHKHFLVFLSQFTNLTSLECHSAGDKRNQAQTFHCIVTGLPKLKHLSWAMHPYPEYLRVSEQCWGETGCPSNQTLTSLELIVYDDSCLPNDTMRSLTGLQKLAVVYVDSHTGRLLKTWLVQTHHLSTLVICGGPPPSEYVRSIPATVTSLTMYVNHLSSADLAAIASQVPGLLHLHLDPWPSDCPTGLMLMFFPTLQSVKLRIWQVGEDNFLAFHRFPSLKRIEVLDAADSPRISELSRQLRVLTNDKISILTSSRRKDPKACYHQEH